MPIECAKHLHEQHAEFLGPIANAHVIVSMQFDTARRTSNIKRIGTYGEMFICLYVIDPQQQQLRMRFMILGGRAAADRYYLKFQLNDPKDPYNYVSDNRRLRRCAHVGIGFC